MHQPGGVDVIVRKEKTDFGIIYIHSLLSKSHSKYKEKPKLKA